MERSKAGERKDAKHHIHLGWNLDLSLFFLSHVEKAAYLLTSRLLNYNTGLVKPTSPHSWVILGVGCKAPI